MVQVLQTTNRRRTTLMGLAAVALGLGACSSGPAADAGDDFSVGLAEAPVFDGCGSSGDDLSYTWTIVEAPADMADDVGDGGYSETFRCARF